MRIFNSECSILSSNGDIFPYSRTFIKQKKLYPEDAEQYQLISNRNCKHMQRILLGIGY